MRWPGRANGSRRSPGAPHAAAPSAAADGSRSPLRPRGPGAERLRRDLPEEVIAEHRRELRRLSGDIDRLSISTTTTGSLVEELASDLGRELDRVRAASVAWAQDPADR